MPEQQQEMTSLVAVLSHQMGELKQAVESSLREIRDQLSAHAKDIGVLKEHQIRADERAAGEDRLRAALAEERERREQSDNTHVTFRLARWQAVCAALLVLIAVASATIAALSAL